MSNSLWTHGLQQARLPCPSLSPEVCSDSCPLSGWCHPTISSSVVPFSSCHQSFPASGSFPVSWFSPSGSQSIGAAASASVLPMNIQHWFPLGLISLISLQPKGLSGVFSTPQFESISSLVLSLLYGPALTFVHDYWESHSFDYTDFVSKVLSLIFNLLSRFVISFSSKEQASFNCMAAVTTRFRISNNLVKSKATDSKNGWRLEEYIYI